MDEGIPEFLRELQRRVGGEIIRPVDAEIDQALQNVVGSTMGIPDIIMLLNKHGCEDIEHLLDNSTSSDHPVAHGGLGDIFKAGLTDGTAVAIKTLRSTTSNSTGTYQKRAAKEIYTWSKCNHPNVVPLVGVCIFRDSLAMVSRWEENGNLLRYLAHHPNADRCQLSTSICAGLSYLHENNIVHGDLKGANIIIAEDGRPQLMDFGNADVLDCTLQFTKTTSGPAFSLRWTAPEILIEKTKYSTAGDVYALGMTILEAFTGEIPYPDKKDLFLLTLVLVKKKIPVRPKKAIPENSIYGNVLWSLLKSCWSHNPKCRPTVKMVWDMMKLMTPHTLQEIEDEEEDDDEMDGEDE